MTRAKYEVLVGRNLRRLRQARGLKQTDLVHMARLTGLGWTQPHVARTEAGKRQLSLGEVVVLGSLLNLQPGELTRELLAEPEAETDVLGVRLRAQDVTAIAAGEPLPHTARKLNEAYGAYAIPQIGRTWERRRRIAAKYGYSGSAQNAWRGRIRGATLSEAAAAAQRTPEQNTARTLGCTPFEVAVASRALWGRWLSDERDRRLKPNKGDSEGTRRARLSHITRALQKELKEFIRAKGVPRRGQTRKPPPRRRAKS